MNKLTNEEIGNLRFQCDDLDKEVTIKEYFKALLKTLWMENECFSGKRPFGNSGWDYDVYACLIKHGAISGSLDEDGYVKEFDTDQADKFVLEYISNM